MKKVLKKDADLKRWCDVLSQSTVQLDKVPEGWFTINALADMSGKSACATSERIRRLIANGTAERKDFVIQLEQTTRKTAHYRLK